MNESLSRQNSRNAIPEVLALLFQVVADCDAIRHLRKGLPDEVEPIQMVGALEIKQGLSVVHESVNLAIPEKRDKRMQQNLLEH